MDPAGKALGGSTTVGFKGVWPCVAYLVVDFGRPMDWFPALEPLRFGLVVGVWGILAVVFKGHTRFPRPVWYIFGLLALMTWQVPWAVNNRWAYWGLETFAILVAAGVVPIALLPSTVDQIRRLLTVYFLVHVPAALHGLWYSGTGPGSWLGDENDLAFALNSSIGVGIYLLLEARTVTRRLGIAVSLCVLMAGVVSTNSRGGFVGCAALGAYLIIRGPYRKTIAVVVVLLAVGLWVVAPSSYWDEVRSISKATEEGDTGDQRLYFWGIAWRMFLDHPITGVGTNNFGIRAPEYQDPNREGWAVHTWGRATHSLYFTVLAEQGFLGLALLGAVVVWFARAARRIHRTWSRRDGDLESRSIVLFASGIAAGLFAVLVTGAFLSVFSYPALWILVAFLAALERVVRSRPTEPSSPKAESVGTRRLIHTLSARRAPVVSG